MPIIRVRAISEKGFCRAKRKFTGDFSVPFEVDKKTLDLLSAEKNLVVEEIPAPPKDKDKDKEKGK